MGEHREETADPTPSSEALDALLNEGGAVADKITSSYHRSTLWRLRTGRRKPEIDTALELERLTKGRVAVAGWSVRKAKAAS